MGISSQTYKPITAEDVKKIDQTSRRILEEVGIHITDRRYLDRFVQAGLNVDFDKQRVRFEAGWLDEHLRTAPSKFVLYSRDGLNDIHVGEGKVHFANGGRVFRIVDMGTGGSRLTMLRDVAHTATLVDHLEHIRFYIVACQAHDLDPEYYHLNDFYHSFNHTSKHVMGGCDNLAGVKQVHELASLIAGGEELLTHKPFVSVITNPISPLTIESNTLQILEFCGQHGIPTTCAPAPSSGATGPATLAGTLAQMHAESLAGVAISQIFCAGAKVLYGAVGTTMDLRKMELAMGSVEMALMNACAVHLAKLYDLPIYASAGVTESKRPDIQAGVEKTLSNMMVAQAGGDCIHLAAGMLDSGNSISLEQYVIDNEVIGMIHRMLAGIRVTDDTLGFDVIKKVGPGGHYIIEDHTAEHMMDEFFYPELATRSNYDIWEEAGKPIMLKRAHDLVNQIIEDNAEGILDPDIIIAIRKAFPELRGVSPRAIN
jgi:trimethylamine--corrinoid protein Co-methyltransferase